jgi:thioredoxin-related protein
VFLSIFAWSYFTRKPETQIQTGLQKGKPLAQIPGVDYKSAPRTLLIAMNSNCGYCNESIPFYRELKEAQREHNEKTRIIAIFSDMENIAKHYVKQKQLDMEAIAEVNLKTLNVDATPTIILVNSSGTILDFWIGKLSPDDEQLVVKSISAPV